MTALRLADQGCHIALNYVHSRIEAEALQAQISAKGVKCIAIQADISKMEDIAKLVEQVEVELGSIDILVNNAGPFVRERRLFADYTEAEIQMLVQGTCWGRCFSTNACFRRCDAKVGPNYSFWFQSCGRGTILASSCSLRCCEGRSGILYEDACCGGGSLRHYGEYGVSR